MIRRPLSKTLPLLCDDQTIRVIKSMDYSRMCAFTRQIRSQLPGNDVT